MEPARTQMTSSAAVPEWKEESGLGMGDHGCCSLVEDTWRNSEFSCSLSPTAESQEPSRSQMPLDIPQPARTQFDLPFPSRDYLKPVPRAIVTMEVEDIGPDDLPHHPYDQPPSHQIHARKPWGICINPLTEQVYVSDRECHSILVFGPDGEYQHRIGKGHGTGHGEFNRPIAMAFDAVGNRLFVADKDNHRVQVFSPSGDFLFAFGSGGKKRGLFLYPWGIAVSKDGQHVAVADSRNRRIQIFTTEGRFFRQCWLSSKGTPGLKNTSYPRGVAFDHSGQYLYVTDFNQRCLFRLDIGCTNLELIVDEHHLLRPSGLDVDAEGNIIVCDSRRNCLSIFQPNGRLLTRISGIGGDPFDLPLDVSVVGPGYLAVLDLNGRVRIF